MGGGNNAALDANGNPIPDPAAVPDPNAVPAPPAPDPNQPLFDQMNQILDGASKDLGVDI